MKKIQLGNLGCEDMKKRTIFDIEKIGFGDEVISKPKKVTLSVTKEEIEELRTIQSVTCKPVLKQEEIELPVMKPRVEKVKPLKTTSPITSSPKAPRFKPVEFISPITGRKENRPKYVQLAHGQYQFSTSSVVETIEDAMNTFLNQENFDEHLQKYEHQEMGQVELDYDTDSINVLNQEELDELISEEAEDNLCPFDSVESNVNALEGAKTKVDSQSSTDETTKIIDSSDENELFYQLDERHQEEDIVGVHLVNEQSLEETLFNESETSQDENFCDEVLEGVLVEEEKESIVYYETPGLDLLKDSDEGLVADDDWILSKMDILEQTFNDFGVKVRLTGDFTQGPTVTQIEIQPESGTKVSKILSLYNDLKLSLSVEELRIEPIAGKNIIGVEIPNRHRKIVRLKEVLSKPEFVLHESPLYIGLGQDISGEATYVDILTMPHGLIAGQTGSGKSVCINTLLISMLYKSSPEDVRLMLIDPKRVELAPYNHIPHLVTPVIVDERKAAMGLKWAVEEMERRYELFASNGVRDIKSFNDRRQEFEMAYAKLPYIVIIIDELADLMMISAQEVEDYIMRITQKARAAGIHLIVATQRPTVDVITGTIKSNIPCRIAFAVAQGNDSRVILDELGAQNLLGRGDMLLAESGCKSKRVQGAYVSDEEIDAVVKFVKLQGKPNYLIPDHIFEKGSNGIKTDCDPMLKDAMRFFFDKGYATASSLQTRMAIGYNRAARIVDTLEMNGWISQPNSSNKQREILISREDFESIVDETRF